MNNKTFKRVVALVASAVMLCSCAFAATIGEVAYKDGKLTVNYTADGASKAAIMVKKGDVIVAVNQHDGIKASFTETLDTEKVGANDVLTIMVGDNAAGSTTAASTTFTIPAPVVNYKVTYGETTTEYAEGTLIADVLPKEVPTKDGDAQYSYTFSKWLVNGEEIAEGATLTADITITAEFAQTVNTYTITLAVDGVAVDTVTAPFGANIAAAIADKTATKEATETVEYTFTGWDVAADATVAGDVTVNAVFEENPIIPDAPKTFTVTFMNGTTTVDTVENVAAGTAISTIVPAEPTKAKNTFIGWYLDDAFTTKMADATVAADTTLYAKFSLTGLYGDADGNGMVNALDYLEIVKKAKNRQYAGKAGTAMADCQTAAGRPGLYGDADANGMVNALDYLEIVKKAKNRQYTGKAGTTMVMVKD